MFDHLLMFPHIQQTEGKGSSQRLLCADVDLLSLNLGRQSLSPRLVFTSELQNMVLKIHTINPLCGNDIQEIYLIAGTYGKCSRVLLFSAINFLPSL